MGMLVQMFSSAILKSIQWFANELFKWEKSHQRWQEFTCHFDLYLKRKNVVIEQNFEAFKKLG